MDVDSKRFWLDQLMVGLERHLNEVNERNQEFLEFASLAGFIIRRGKELPDPQDRQGFEIVVRNLINEVLEKITNSTDTMLTVVKILNELLEGDNSEVSGINQEPKN